MKFRVTMKDPDGVYDSMSRAVEQSLPEDGLDEEEREQLSETRADLLKKFTGKWLQYSEYAVIEFDTDAGTAILVEVR